MEVFIAGTRGIPNRYGGFEQFAEKLSGQLAERELAVTVFNPDTHAYKDEKYGRVSIVRKKNYEKYLGPFGTLLYDYHCLKHAYRHKPGLVLLCGYTTSFIPWVFFRKHVAKTIVHMDGMEWQRSKWHFITRWLIKKSEKFTALRFPHLLVDHPALADYYSRTYSVSPHVISYGAEPGTVENLAKEHYLLIARLEPENNVEMILEGYLRSGAREKMLVVGDVNTTYGRKLLKKYGLGMQIVFTGGIFETKRLRELRKKSILYFHGHSVGGTNPSLLQAMADGCLIAAHYNEFNRFVLEDNGLYFQSSEEVCEIILKKEEILLESKKSLNANIRMIESHYNWEKIAGEYQQLFESMIDE